LDAIAADPSSPIAEDARLARRRQQTQAWRRRSRLIRRLRRILPAGIVVILLLMAGWVLVKGHFSGLGEGRRDGAVVYMTNARFYGRDGDGHAYVLAAAEASRPSGDMGAIDLIKPSLIFNADSLKPTQATSDRGVYRPDTRLLTLTGHVVASNGAGETFRTQTAVADTLHLVINGWNRVQGVGPTGTITADSFGIYDRGQSIVFTGNVHSVVKPD
jgi:lipopolysaccharide export system protein LptC